MTKFSSLLFCTLIFLAGCKKYTPESDIPGYIKIDKVSLSTDYSLQGSINNDINELWVYVDEQPIGVYPIGSSMPVLLSGTHKITVKPGVNINGYLNIKSIYPFYSTYSADITLNSNHITEISNINFTYTPDALFPYKEDFESGVSMDSTANSNTSLKLGKDKSVALEGGYGIIKLDANHLQTEIATHDLFTLPKNKNNVFELNYKSEETITIGIFSLSTNGDLAQTFITSLPATDTWKKAYVNLAPRINSHADARDFKVYIYSVKTITADTSHIYLDNLKIVSTGS